MVVVADVLPAKSEQVGLVQGDNVIQHFPAYAFNPSFGDAVLPGAPNPSSNGFQSAAFRKASTSPLNLLSWSNTTYRYGQGSGNASRSC